MPTFRQLLEAPKVVASPARARNVSKPGHRGIEVKLDAPTVTGSFRAVLRVNERMVERFSCILTYEDRGLPTLALLRVNGDHGIHRNPDGTVITGPHIHFPANLSASPEVDSEPEAADVIDQRNAVMTFAWDYFCQQVNVHMPNNVAKAVGRLHTALSQGSLDEFLRQL
jgi:hypothetical protein